MNRDRAYDHQCQGSVIINICPTHRDYQLPILLVYTINKCTKVISSEHYNEICQMNDFRKCLDLKSESLTAISKNHKKVIQQFNMPSKGKPIQAPNKPILFITPERTQNKVSPISITGCLLKPLTISGWGSLSFLSLRNLYKAISFAP